MGTFMGTYILGTGTLGWIVWWRGGIPCSWNLPTYPSVLYPPAGASWFCISHLRPSYHLDECGFFNSLVIKLPYGSVFWWFLVMAVLYFHCNFALVVQGGKLHLAMPPSWQEASSLRLHLAFFLIHLCSSPNTPAPNSNNFKAFSTDIFHL